MLSHLFIAQVYGHIQPPQGMDGSSMPVPYGHIFCVPDLGLLYQSARHNGKRGACVEDHLVNLSTYFDRDPENQILIFGAAPLSLFRDFHFHPNSLQALRMPVEPALLGVLALLGGASAEGVAYSPLVTRGSPLRVGLGVPLQPVGGAEDLRPPPVLPIPGDPPRLRTAPSGLPLLAFLCRSFSAFLSFANSRRFMWNSSS